MALHRGIQSALFYYLSCAPCTGYSYRKKRRKEATRDRAEKHAMEMEQPGLYRHPSPFATNPHWQTEIDLGPGHATTRRMAAGKDTQKPAKAAPRARDSDENGSTVASTVSLGLVPADSNDSTWNLRRCQREDEELWGSNMPARSSRSRGLEGSVINGRGTISRPTTARTAETDRSTASYYSTANPPINDLHPAIITRINSAEDAMWMLQPPPIAHVMAGREKPNRHRSDSGASRLSSRRGGDKQLSRQVSQRIVGDKLKAGELLPAIALSRESSGRTVHVSPGSTPMCNFDSSSSDDGRAKRRRRRPPPINVSEDTSHSARTVVHADPLRLSSTDTRDVSPRRKDPRRHLSPIMSDDASSDRTLARHSGSRGRSTDSLVDDRRSQRRPALAAKSRQDSSLNVLQELVPANSLLKVQAQALSKSPSFEARIELPPTDAVEEMELLGSGKAGFDSWYETKEFSAFPQWAADRVRRNVSSRWSVDF
ncbi:hypothetical protein MBLNU459_g6889t1 [Dothideomycetes sp. NU459]